MVAGILPEKLLCPSRTISKFTMFPIHMGSSPLKLFESRSRIYRSVHLCKEGGNFPENRLLLKISIQMFCEWKHSVSSPSKKLFDKSKIPTERNCIWHIDCGTWPVILLEKRRRSPMYGAPKFSIACRSWPCMDCVEIRLDPYMDVITYCTRSRSTTHGPRHATGDLSSMTSKFQHHILKAVFSAACTHCTSKVKALNCYCKEVCL